MDSTESTPHTIVIGAGLSGLILTHRLHAAGHKVTLLEARELLGGRYRRPNLTYSSPGLDFIPAQREPLELLAWLKNISPVPLNFTIRDHRPQIFAEGHWKPFAGFGDVSFQSVGELSALFAHTQGVDLKPGLEHLTRALIEQLPLEAHVRSEVTSLRVHDGKVTEVVVNGDKSLRADKVIFTAPPMLLGALIKGEGLPVKHRTRLAKLQSWTAVTLELSHAPPLIEDDSIHIFSHSAKEFEPVLGRVFGEISKWLTLVPGDREAEHEFIGQCIRHIKRQLKRAWPSALDVAPSVSRERIYVEPHAFGQQALRGSGKENYRFAEISNLYLANHALASVPGELGAVETAKALTTELCGPLNQLPELGASC